MATWNSRVASRIESGETHKLDGQLRAYVEHYDFTSFGYATLDEILDAHRRTAYWASRFGGLLPAPPKGHVPQTLSPNENVYVGKLLDVYAEKTGQSFKCVNDLAPHVSLSEDLQKQRVRFYDAEAFVAHYRDQTEPGTVEDFAEQIYDAIEPILSVVAGGEERLRTALVAAGQTTPANVLAPQAKVRVKQGVCHQLANIDRLTWKV